MVEGKGKGIDTMGRYNYGKTGHFSEHCWLKWEGKGAKGDYGGT